MSDRDDLPQAQIIDDRLQVTELLPEAVRRAGGLVGLPEPQEVERHDAPAGVDEMGNEIRRYADCRKAMHEHKCGIRARIVAGVDVSLSVRNVVLDET